MKIHSSPFGAALGVASLMILAESVACAAENWKPLFNGRNLDGWEMFMTNPDPSWDVPGLKRDANGRYLEPIGKNKDPLKVFNVEMVDGRPAIHITGQGFGVITTKESFANFHVRLQVKWGESKWGSKLNAPRDTGLLYFVHGEPGFDHATWPRSVEFRSRSTTWATCTRSGPRSRSTRGPKAGSGSTIREASRRSSCKSRRSATAA